jgi:hypothetical protein
MEKTLGNEGTCCNAQGKESFGFCKTKAALKTNSKSRLCTPPLYSTHKSKGINACSIEKVNERIHCEKNLFVLASCQKIPILRTENPGVDIGTIYPLPIEFFYNPPCQKSYGRKIPASDYR